MKRIAALLAAMLAAMARGQGTVPGGAESEDELVTMPTLWQGDSAPELHVGKWLKGAPVAKFEAGRVYVVEFWATWCRPCVASMPHLSELQAKYREKGVMVIGVTREDRHNTLEKAEAMVREKGEGMAYTVAWDDGSRTYDAFMRATRQHGIPCAFLISGEGKLVWIGHPLRLDNAIEGLLDGRLDVKAEAAATREWQAKEIAGRKADRAREAAMKREDWAGVVKACRDLEATGSANYSYAYGEELEALLVRMGRYEEGYGRAREIVAGPFHDDAAGLSRVAWTIAAFDGVEPRDLDLAEDAALRGIEAGPGNPFVWRALGAVEFRRGEKEKALRLMEKALKLGGEEWRADLEPAVKWVKGEVGSPMAK